MNSRLRESAMAMSKRVMGADDRLVVPAPDLCTDNAAMIAVAGARLYARGAGADLTVDPGLRLG